MGFNQRLHSWYHKNHRKLPWRANNDPYQVWLSEVLLQQTRVDQGLPYYYRFIENYPTLPDMARANEDQVLLLWQGLGYYSRGRNMLKAAREMMAEYGGFPTNYNSIRSLTGIGDYTAAAIASIAFNQPYPVVDGNVYRFLSRFYGIKTAIDTTAGKREFAELATSLLDKKNPGQHNQALMEFGALVCRPKPVCSSCIFNKECYAFQQKKTADYPVKAKKLKTKERFFNYLIIESGKKVYIGQRTGNDIWQGLFEFPMIELNDKTHLQKAGSSMDLKKIIAGKPELVYHSPVIRHQLTHQTLHAVFSHYRLNASNKLLVAGFKKINIQQLHLYAMPQLIRKYLRDSPIIPA